MDESLKKELFEWLKAIVVSLIVVFFIKFFIFDIMAIDGISMEPTLHDKDRVFVNIAGYKLENPEHGDVIIFTPSIDKDSYYVKRVIGVAGDEIRIKNGRVFVNNVELNEIYLTPGTRTEGNVNLKVPEGTIFVLGDNRNNSEDSRDPRLGPVPLKSIKGRVSYRVFPFNKVKKI